MKSLTVSDGLLSPVKLLQGKALHDLLPVDTEQCKVQSYDNEQMKELLGERQSKMKHYHDSHAGTEKELLKTGSNVVFKTAKGTWIPGSNVALVGESSYEIKGNSGMVFRRNSVDVRKAGQPLSKFETVKDVIQNIPPSKQSHGNLPKQASEQTIVGSQTTPVSDQIVASSHSALEQVSDTRSKTPLAKFKHSLCEVSQTLEQQGFSENLSG